MQPHVNIFWFRRDLRLDDNAGLYHGLKSHVPLVPIFIFDSFILDKLEHKNDARVEFIYLTLQGMKKALEKQGATIEIYYGEPMQIFKSLVLKYNIENVFANTDYEPYATERDEAVSGFLKNRKIGFLAYKDQVIFHKEEIIKDNGEPYTVFTPYSKKWKMKLSDFFMKSYPATKYLANLFKQPPVEMPSLLQLGFEKSGLKFPEIKPEAAIIKHYGSQRDFPGIEGTSRLGIHLRFGTISIRQLARQAATLSETYLNELIWRDFYQMILWHFPRVGRGRAFKEVYENIPWRQDAGEFEKWCNGQTGYPIVDAGMRQLNATGFMHNRVRMITASFLCKHLLLDWRLGEAYFAEKLLDYDLASNNGGWQWAAGSGCDAAPYFRIFNPYLQTKRFDADFKYIKKWVPEFQDFGYPAPIVNHEFARKRCIEVYSRALNKNKIL